MTGLVWEDRSGAPLGDCWWAWSDQLNVGYVLRRKDGSIWFDATSAVYMKHVAKGSGVVPSFEAGKRAVEKAWTTWLMQAGLLTPA